MKDLILGLFAVGIGVALVFKGYRIARILIPIWGFFIGFLMGASGVSDALNSSFIGTTLGIGVGLVMGLVFGLLAYFFFSLSIILLGATFGYWLGTGFITLIGFNKGFLSAMVGISLGVFLAIISIAINAPKYYLIVVSAFAGATSVFGGILIAINKIQPDSLNYAITGSKINLPVFWGILTLVLAIIGLVYQTRDNKGQQIDQWGTPFADQKPKQVKSQVV